ncbi:MAG: ribonuclease III [SAR86 cluster bacterium]|uniref:Ribonuclease 3 n=1 Tax=SAR86 cluster bacterium TaxID=2030880 RepID=A0A2A4MGU6_9GAMM|nr:MAG: ribonuclease III [SAR86 cluster bacterium]
MTYAILEKQLNYRFSDPDLIAKALTHRSANTDHNERLEFLGDALLGLVIAQALYERFPESSEGDLSRMRANLVNKNALALIANQLALGDLISLGSGESKSGGNKRESILSDAVEAIIAATYLDGGMTACKNLVLLLCEQSLSNVAMQSQLKDSKTRLQEYMQAQGLHLPLYKVVSIDGVAHDQTFRVNCLISLLSQPAQGSGKSKRIAEQQAAEKVLQTLGV